MDGSDKINFYNYVTGVNSGERTERTAKSRTDLNTMLRKKPSQSSRSGGKFYWDHVTTTVMYVYLCT